MSKPNPFLQLPSGRGAAQARAASPEVAEQLAPLLAGLARLAVEARAARAVTVGLGQIAAHFAAAAVQMFAADAQGGMLCVARWDRPDATGAAENPTAHWPGDLAQGDVCHLAPGAAFPGASGAAVTLVPLRMGGDLAGMLRIRHGDGHVPATPGAQRHPGFAALGDLMQVLSRPADRADAGQDMLTGLPDARGFGAVLARATPEQGASVLILDIDNFRSIKTVLGRAVSDALLRAVALRLGDMLGGQGTLARSDGDAFAVLVPGGVQAADRLARDFRHAMARPFELNQITVYVTASIGISRLGDAHEAPPGLVRQAEVASFAARTAGGNRQIRYTRTMDAQLSRRGQVVQALRHALGNNQFTLAFQPKFRVADDPLTLSLAGAEALLRWNAPTLGEVSPDEFIPIAEASGVITEIDTEVIAIFARQLGQWRRAGHDLPVSINLSPRSFEDDTLAARMLATLAGEAVAPAGVTVEITETSLISMSPAARLNLARFRAAGIVLAVDDFGTGYSSLGYLQDLIVSEIKIDRRYIQPLPPRAAGCGTEKIARTLVTLARTLDLRVVAEGVETAAQAEWLAREGCHLIQGYLGGRAVAPPHFAQLYLGGGPV